jgi:hypothetical protein
MLLVAKEILIKIKEIPTFVGSEHEKNPSLIRYPQLYRRSNS